MAREVGPVERRLREMREERHAKRSGKAPSVAELRQVVARAAARARGKPRKAKRP